MKTLPLNTERAIASLMLADAPAVLTLDDVAEICGRCRTWAYERVRTGSLMTLDGHGDIFVSRLALLAWLLGVPGETMFRVLLDAQTPSPAAADLRQHRDDLHAVHERRLARAGRQAEQRQGGRG